MNGLLQNSGGEHRDGSMGVVIAGRRVGLGQPTLVVAEAGVNHNGCVETALRMVDVAVDAGADAIKFQLFRANELTTRDAPTAPYQLQRVGASSQRALLAKLELSFEDFRRIQRRCAERNLPFLLTPFSEPDVARAVDLGVVAIKIASTDLTNNPLLDAAAAAGLPMIVSTGAATVEEMCSAVERLKTRGTHGRLILLHCVSCYPTPLEALNLRAIEALRRTFGVPSGLSDHTPSVDAGAWAVAAGACALEKHFTLDPTAWGPDHAMSLSPWQLGEYVAQTRAIENALGTGILGMTEAERSVRDAARKSVVAAVDILAGTPLHSRMLALKRPGTGIPAAAIDRLVGRRATRNIPGDTMLAWDMVR